MVALENDASKKREMALIRIYHKSTVNTLNFYSAKAIILPLFRLRGGEGRGEEDF